MTLALHWTGGGWSRVPTPNPRPPLPPAPADVLYAVTAVTASDVWAVGGDGEMSGEMAAGIALRWNGHRWAAARIPRLREGGQLQGVAAVSSREVWAVGSGGVTSAFGAQVAYAMRWNGARWSKVSVPQPGMFHGLNAIARIPASRGLWAVGFRAARRGSPQYPLIERWTGSRWVLSRAPAVAGGYLTGVTALSGRDAWAVGDISSARSTRPLILHWNGTRWSLMPANSPSPLTDVAAATARTAFAAGGTILQWNGSSWHAVPWPHRADAILNALTLARDHSGWTAWAAGNSSSAALIVTRCG